MSPDIGKWVRHCFGKDTGTDETQNTLKMEELIKTLGGDGLLKIRANVVDSETHFAVLVALQKLYQKCS